MRIALAQQNYHTGNFEANASKIFKAIDDAIAHKADLIVFPEMAVMNYTHFDTIFYNDFFQKAEQLLHRIQALSTEIAIIIGGPLKNNKAGKPYLNVAYCFENGKINAIVPKTLLPDYDIFDDYRYFEPGVSKSLITLKGHKIALTICEDLWNFGPEKLYPIAPMDQLIAYNPAFIINIAASPFSYNQNIRRAEMLNQNTMAYKLPIMYLNQVGGHTQYIFDGSSKVVNSNGAEIATLPAFQEALAYFDFINKAFVPVTRHIDSLTKPSKEELIYKALILGISDFFKKNKFKKAIVGLSGGVDSALVLVLAVEALGAERVEALLLPSAFSTDHSISDAKQLLQNLKVKGETIAIAPIFDQFLSTLSPFFNGLPFSLAEENLQSRIRGNILMAFSNKFGHILLNTSNKSELAVGYGTLYGDMAGALSVIGDLYKTEVYKLCEYINTLNGYPLIPEHILTKAPSAELRPDQKDQDSLPPYDILDDILYKYIEENKSLNQLIELGYDKTTALKTVQLVEKSEFKRFQFAPILRISNKAFGYSRKMPLETYYSHD